LIGMFDGKISVEESIVPQGTTFLIKLPVAGQEKEK